jgi:hypothetical protein
MNFRQISASGYGLRVTGYGLRVTGYGLRVTGYGLRGTGYGERVTGNGRAEKKLSLIGGKRVARDMPFSRARIPREDLARK